MPARLPGIPDHRIILPSALNPVHSNPVTDPLQPNLLVWIVQNTLVQRKATIGEMHHEAAGPPLRIKATWLELEISIEDHGSHDHMPGRRHHRPPQTSLNGADYSR